MNEEYDFVKRMAIVTKLAEKKPGLGRTALMKYMYLLQAVRSVRLGYRFQLYAYGPYDSTVLNDLATAEAWDAVEEQVALYPSGYGYEIKLGSKANELLQSSSEFLQKHEKDIAWVIDNFSEYGAAGLELLGTMVWADREAGRANERRSTEDLINLVLEIKPRFSRDQAQRIADKLKKLGVLVATN